MGNTNDIIQGYLEIPAVQIVLSVLTILYAILKILSCTSIGKKAIKSLTKLYEAGKAENERIAKEYDQFKKDKEQEIIDLTKDYELKIQAEKDHNKKFEKQVIGILEMIPNERVQNAVKEIDLTRNECPDLVEEIAKAKEEVKNEYEESVKYVVDCLRKRIEVLENGKEENINGTSEEEQVQ